MRPQPVTIEKIESVPVSSIRRQDELGSVETGDATLNRFIKNVYWGQLSNYLSVPTDCPQRNERLGWAADTQVFAELASFNADVYDFLRTLVLRPVGKRAFRFRQRGAVR